MDLGGRLFQESFHLTGTCLPIFQMLFIFTANNTAPPTPNPASTYAFGRLFMYVPSPYDLICKLPRLFISKRHNMLVWFLFH